MPSARPPTLALRDILFTQGFGTRRTCDALILGGHVRVAGQMVDDPRAAFATDRLVFEMDGVAWPYHDQALILLHKPAGYECSLRPSAWPGVHTLLPPPLRQRGVQPIGRLDQDTTGLLLLTDDGTLLHRLTSPKHHVPKVYHARTVHPVTTGQCARLVDGVVLHDDPQPVRAAAARALDDHLLELTLTQGKYHQVKRMVAAVSNRVETLHRVAFGALTLPPDLAPGQWRWVREQDLFGTPAARPANTGHEPGATAG